MDHRLGTRPRPCPRKVPTSEEKALKGLLTERNECAHPSDYEPDLNETLGYVSKVLKRVWSLQKQWSKP